MIGNPRKADLLRDRASTLEAMKLGLEKLKYIRNPTQRASILASVKELGQVAVETKALIEKEDREGIPLKWKAYYEIIEKLHEL